MPKTKIALKQDEPQLKVIDFFCGAGGMSYGLMKAGLCILGGIDSEIDCKKTYEKNLPGAIFLCEDITKLSEDRVAEIYNLKKYDDNLVFAGCSPCQFWSKVNTDRDSNKKTAFLLRYFQNFINHFRPGFVVIENVPGLKNKKEHSLLPAFLSFLDELGYAYDDKVINASHYGVPQQRRRYVLVATRLKNVTPKLPDPTEKKIPTVRKTIGNESKIFLKPLKAGEKDERDKLHRAAALSSDNLERIKRTPKNGGDRNSWKNSDLQITAYKNKDEIFKDVYGRMFWDKPAPTITTRFNSLSNGRFGHPEQDRAISFREGALLQTFPKSFKFYAKTESSLAKQIGNAVPPELAKRIGRQLKRLVNYG